MSAAKSSRSGGFTLIELVVAFAIAAMALAAVYEASSGGLRAGAAAGQYSRALLLARSALEAAGVEAPLAAGVSTRREGEYEEEIRVTERPDLVPAAATPRGAFPYEVAVDVRWREAGRTRSVTLSTIRLGPAP
ncbi:MAG TPA: prepilin-type N-terminal cleavage/methylation domain-containing protein [Stellaceae bacterium]|nr:prepilin-type N-terminal cleavage/methylation domain-containing protein [Stellaceae bacterium]